MVIQDLGQYEGISKAGNPWKKHEWLLETEGQYPRKIKFTVFGDRVNTITFELGKKYTIQVDVESREFNGRWYTDLTAYSSSLKEDSENSGNTNWGNNNVSVNAGGQSLDSNPFGTQTIVETDFTQNDSQEDLPF